MTFSKHQWLNSPDHCLDTVAHEDPQLHAALTLTPERYASRTRLVDVMMRQSRRPCSKGEMCDVDGACPRHQRFSADRCVALLDRWKLPIRRAAK